MLAPCWADVADIGQVLNQHSQQTQEVQSVLVESWSTVHALDQR